MSYPVGECNKLNGFVHHQQRQVKAIEAVPGVKKKTIYSQ